MKLITWNVNGLRACMNKGFADFMQQADADIFCIQETKMQREQSTFEFPGYHEYWNSAVKKGYSGTAIFTKEEPENVTYGLGIEEHDQEGRVITAEYPGFILVNVYTPNSQRGLVRLDYREKWEDAFQDYVSRLAEKKPVIVCGDLNVAAQPIDLKNPDSNHKNAGFSDQERAKFQQFLQHGFVDSFRSLYPDREGAYTWWSYMFKARERNAGWRIDYFLVSANGKEHIQDVVIHNEIFGSDHCPVELDWKE
ncbi:MULTISPECIES: exodeoxyribonuclease III [Acidaminococcus]|uniref:exodeoxyribonuclease III n=1 Tax=Acidaminococcus TaxID=904 RepID=UPI0008DA0210|nr:MULTISPECIES: exodeoxyribonuclease III [Acidaminococcus]MDO5597796.1 exodeoxyribonuclease III [Acidaminococcus sp.]